MNSKSGSSGPKDRAFLLSVARRAMIERGLRPDFPPAAMNEVTRIASRPAVDPVSRDLRGLLWCSIDNDDSRDLDQLTVAEGLPGGGARVFVAIADVSASIDLGSALDEHAEANTVSVYTPVQNFPMLPNKLSEDLTSLVEGEDRPSMVVQMEIDAGGMVGVSDVYPALVRNRAKLAYPSLGAWLEGEGEMPPKVAAVPGLADNIRLQDKVAQQLKAHRHEHGALELETIEARFEFDGDEVSGMHADKRNRAKEVIEDFMIAANGVIARFLQSRGYPVLRRAVRSPERWGRIVQIAAERGGQLPGEPDAKALNEFLMRRRAEDPVGFPDLSLSVIKLMGRGEYVASFPGDETSGHFGLAVNDYTHSTAPNRRYPDLITQRLIKAAIAGHATPYTREPLESLAAHCTRKEDDAKKVERQVEKSAAAVLLAPMIGRDFEGIVTGAADKGTWVRIFDPPAEGRVERGAQGLDVGERVRVKLIHTDAERGYIDFARE